MRKLTFSLCIIAASLSAQEPNPATARAWLKQSADALGGEAKLRALKAVEISGISIWQHREQSERPEGPWIPDFTEFTDVRNFDASAIRRTSRTRGFVVEDDTAWSPESTLLVIEGVGLRRMGDRLLGGGAPWDLATLPIDLGPDRSVTTALDAPDLRAEPDVSLHGYAHHAVSFTHHGARVRLILNVPGMLPKAIEITRPRPFETFWAPWGDVTQTLTLGVWLREPNGLRFPRLWEYSTGGQPDGTVDITRVRFNPTVNDADFAVPNDVREQFITNRRRVADFPLGSPQRPAKELAPGLVQVPGSWDVVEVKQDDGVIVIEGPLTSAYSERVVADAQQRFAGAKVKAVVTTSDAWPHIGGLREYVARGIPIYALDRNMPILTRLFAAPYATFPDALAKTPRAPIVKAVSAKMVVGTGANRLELYPFRTATGERQMMVYFPAHKILYTSDLFTIRGTMVFLPQQVSEAVEAAAREHLEVVSAFGMHYDVLPWDAVVRAATPAAR